MHATNQNVATNTGNIATNTAAIAKGIKFGDGGRGNIAGVGCHILIGGMQLAACYRIGDAGNSTVARSGAKPGLDVGGDAGITDAVTGGQLHATNQNVATNTGNIATNTAAIAKGIKFGDGGRVGGNIAGVGCHILIGGMQLAACYRIGDAGNSTVLRSGANGLDVGGDKAPMR